MTPLNRFRDVLDRRTVSDQYVVVCDFVDLPDGYRPRASHVLDRIEASDARPAAVDRVVAGGHLATLSAVRGALRRLNRRPFVNVDLERVGVPYDAHDDPGVDGRTVARRAHRERLGRVEYPAAADDLDVVLVGDLYGD